MRNGRQRALREIFISFIVYQSKVNTLIFNSISGGGFGFIELEFVQNM